MNKILFVAICSYVACAKGMESCQSTRITTSDTTAVLRSGYPVADFGVSLAAGHSCILTLNERENIVAAFRVTYLPQGTTQYAITHTAEDPGAIYVNEKDVTMRGYKDTTAHAIVVIDPNAYCEPEDEDEVVIDPNVYRESEDKDEFEFE